MDQESPQLTCFCGRSFAVEHAYSKHIRSCGPSGKRLASALEGARERYRARKRQRLNPPLAADTEETLNGPSGFGLAYLPQSNLKALDPPEHSALETYSELDDSQMSLVARKPWRKRLDRQLPKRYRDVLPQAPSSLPPSHISTTNSASVPRSHTDKPVKIFTSSPNKFGLFRRYYSDRILAHDPEEHVSLENLSDIPLQMATSDLPLDLNPFFPYPNRSSFVLGEWFWNGGVQKSHSSFKSLVGIITDPHFQRDDLADVKWDQINTNLSANFRQDWEIEDAAWMCTPVSISVPYQNRRGFVSDPKAGPKDYIVGDFHHRSLVSTIKEKMAKLTDTDIFHFEPYELFWKKPGFSNPIRVQGELYTSPAFVEAHQELQSLPGEPGCDLPRVVASLMFWSDATHLTSFGNAKLWPLYLFFGNDSKYRRCKPTSHLCEHVAYFQHLPDAFKEFASTQTAGGKAPSVPFLTHCHRELLHEQWKILLDDDFLEAWKHGIVIKCFDGIERRFYPRIFTYSADYPEKILIASIRNLGRCPCPRCLIPLVRVHNLGMPGDMAQRISMARIDNQTRRNRVYAARRLIYEKNVQVNSSAIEDLLRETSSVPTMNAFSEKLSSLGFDIHPTLLPDLMHEVELGGWRAIFIHLLRILQSHDEQLLVELDRRFREIPAFGRDTIRRFSANCSEMKKLAARDFENLLQCAIPVFDGLLPEPHNQVVCQLLFEMGHWHGLAKMRMHNDVTLQVMDNVTTSLGKRLRDFSNKTCAAFQTKELRREQQARIRREARKPSLSAVQQSAAVASAPPLSLYDHSHQPSDPTSTALRPSVPEQQESPQNIGGTSTRSTRRPKTLNINTYKFHSYGDYVRYIRTHGTTDSYSTEPGELEHRTPKSWFTRTSRKGFIKQLTQIERRQARIRRIRAQMKKDGKSERENASIPLESHFGIGKSQNYPEKIPIFLKNNSGDPAIKDFVPNLKKHILPRIKTILQQESSSSPDSPTVAINSGLSGPDRREIDSREDHDAILFRSETMYRHKLARFNYTTYDIRRNQDVINPTTSHRDIMLLAKHDRSGDNAHPFLYARVLGIYHVNVVYTGEAALDYNPRRIEFLWVRWFKYVGTRPTRWSDLRLDSVAFPPMRDESAFGFVDPGDVLRGCHILPSFSSGRLHSDGIALSRNANDACDYSRYFVNRFVDRDMLMRYHWGLAIGHVYTYESVEQERGGETRASQDSYDVEATVTDMLHADRDTENTEDFNTVSTDLEYNLENLEDDWINDGDEDEDEEEKPDDEPDDELLEALDEMFGPEVLDT